MPSLFCADMFHPLGERGCLFFFVQGFFSDFFQGWPFFTCLFLLKWFMGCVADVPALSSSFCPRTPVFILELFSGNWPICHLYVFIVFRCSFFWLYASAPSLS